MGWVIKDKDGEYGVSDRNLKTSPDIEDAHVYNDEATATSSVEWANGERVVEVKVIEVLQAVEEVE